MIKLNLKNNRGFTLLEALVAVSILMVAVSAPITIAQKGLSSAIYSKDQMIASYLAQDAIEYIKNKRDEASINDVNFNWGGVWTGAQGIDLSTCLISINPNGCQIDTKSDEIASYSDSILLKIDDDGFYQYDLGRDTRFKRKIQIENPIADGGNTDEALVVVTVDWGGTPLVVKTLIYNY